uniref:Aspartic peptidase DDI1-type domain-containing protein n=1 Tax=Cajanus cajan TaxID=3821 RepID=A0A151T527_CAJCA|nr:hypothetical protein KK1_016656 [Cajanus cajan]
MGRNGSALLQKKNVSAIIPHDLLPDLPQKCKDPGTFTIPCTIGEEIFTNAMLDLGASINVMPASVFRSLQIGDLIPTGVSIQLANRSIVQPLGVVEDVLVKVEDLLFPADFYILEMEDESSSHATLILGRPFLRTARTKIDVHAGTLSMEFGDNLVQFNIFEAMRHPIENHSVFSLDVIDLLVDDCTDFDDDLLADFSDFTDPLCTCDDDSSMCAICAEISVAISGVADLATSIDVPPPASETLSPSLPSLPVPSTVQAPSVYRCEHSAGKQEHCAMCSIEFLFCTCIIDL